MIGATITRPARQWHNMVERVPLATDEQVRVECIAGVVTFRLEDGTTLEVSYDDLREATFKAKHGPDASPCACGCGEPTKPYTATSNRRGIVQGEPTRYLKGHNSRRPGVPACGYVVDPESGCWIWQLKRFATGYGVKQDAGRTRAAHIVEWERANGPVPDGLQLDHLCRNRACVNPAHLEPVTHTENVRRGLSTKLTTEDVVAIRASTDSHQVLAERYGVTKSTISHVLTRANWKDVA